MPRHIRYNLKTFQKASFKNNLIKMKAAGFSGVVIPAARQDFNQQNVGNESEFHPLEPILEIAQNIEMQVTFDFNIFESRYLWFHKNFSQPVNYNNLSYFPGKKINYYPICPNNPLAQERVDNIIEILKKLTHSSTILLSELSFPFDWKYTNLEVQESEPPFCYCPFCLGEFSEYIEEMITEPDQIRDNIRFWMDWRISVIYDYFEKISSELFDSNLIISIPPLSLIDIPFVTGQIPIAFLKNQARISPPLLHRTQKRDFRWVMDQLQHYDTEMREDELVPIFEVQSKDMDEIKKLESKGFRDVIYSDWDNYLQNCKEKI